MQKTNRDLADEIRSAYLTDTHWRRNADLLIRSLLTTDEEDEMTCQECETVLPEYLLAEREGTSDLARWRSVVLHLTLCPHCANELKVTSELMALGLGERGGEPLHTPAPDLSFLRDERKKAAQPQADFWHFDKMGQLIIRLAAALLPPPTRLAPAYALRNEEEVSASEAGGRGSLGRLFIGSPTLDDLQVDVTVLPSKDDPALCTVVARVETPSRWPDMTGSEVTLVAGDFVKTVVTDEAGEATFGEVALTTVDSATLSVRVKRRGAD